VYTLTSVFSLRFCSQIFGLSSCMRVIRSHFHTLTLRLCGPCFTVGQLSILVLYLVCLIHTQIVYILKTQASPGRRGR
jgi:hypothetical protein